MENRPYVFTQSCVHSEEHMMCMSIKIQLLSPAGPGARPSLRRTHVCLSEAVTAHGTSTANMFLELAMCVRPLPQNNPLFS